MPSLPDLPMVGRGAELSAVEDAIQNFGSGGGSVVFVTGEAGVGKTRFVASIADVFRRRGWTVLEGGAYAIETGVPFAIFAEAFVPSFQEMGDAGLSVLTRGAVDTLRRLFPALTPAAPPDAPTPPEADSRTQLFWGMGRILEGMSARAPILVILDDLQWSDPSSMELLHFLARHVDGIPVVFLATINEDERDLHPSLADVERSLEGLALSSTHRLEALGPHDVERLIRETFDVGPAASGRFARRLHESTGGNPLLVEATLATRVELGRLYRAAGVWAGWEGAEGDPPGSVRAVLAGRVERLSATSREVARLAAAVGTRVRHDVLRHASDLPDAELAGALDDLTARGVLRETVENGRPAYDFRHPMVRAVLTEELGGATGRVLHLRIAEAIESVWGADAVQRAHDLALHFSKAAPGEAAGRAAPYLIAAGREALVRFADHEAADYLGRAFEATAPDAPARPGLVEDLGRARRRLGDTEGAIALWRTGAEVARAAGDPVAEARLLHRIGLAHFAAADPESALDAYDRALPPARAAVEPGILGRILVSRGMCLQGIGRVTDAEASLLEALALAEADGAHALLARTHRALLLFHTWSGPPERARFHGAEAVSRAEAAADPALACSCHWASAVLEGLSGQTVRTEHHLEIARRLNEDVDSPFVRVAIAELEVELAYGAGEWTTAVALGEDAIALCRALNQQSLLPRLLVWTGLVHLARGADERSGAYLQEAMDLAAAGLGVHSVVPARIGWAARHLALGETEAAVRTARLALEIVDRTGYRRWAAHRLLPLLAEAYLIDRNLDGAREIGARMLAEAAALDDPLALAWSEACAALTSWLAGDPGAAGEAADRLRAAAERLEAVPYVPDALRVRRRLAACLADLGRRDEAVHELRRVHDGFERLGAERELDKTRQALREIGSRPPVRAPAPGMHGLTPREHEVVALVGEGRSNKAIGRALGVSARTAERHLTNVYRKLGVGSRADLATLARTLPRRD